MIRGFIETSMVDWDGKISAVIFFDQCNFLCPFCQNWELIIDPEKFPIVEWEHIEKMLLTKKGWVDGVVLTGGEPMYNEQELIETCEKIRDLGFLIKIDTNGGFPDTLQRAVDKKIADYIAMDIKAPLDKTYIVATGKQVDLEKIKRSMGIIMNSGIDYEFRTTCVPGIIDEPAIHQIGSTIIKAKKWALQAYVPDNAYKKLYRKELTPEYHGLLKKYHEIAKKYVANTVLRAKI
jgi:pyruvate formate lyase activating enzyme